EGRPVSDLRKKGSGARVSWPLLTSQTLAVPSKPADAKRLPSGLQARERIGFPCPGRSRTGFFGLSGSQRWIFVSRLDEAARRLPSGLQAKRIALFVRSPRRLVVPLSMAWAGSRGIAFSPGRAGQTVSDPAKVAAANHLPSGLSASSVKVSCWDP